jgi:hypothetical protein
LEEIANKEREISRLTQECVELRMNHIRNHSSSPELMRSRTPSFIEKDSLNSSVHSNLEPQVPMDSSFILSDKEEAQKLSDSRMSPIEQVNGEDEIFDGIAITDDNENIISEKTVIDAKDCTDDGRSEIPEHLPQSSANSEANHESFSLPSINSQNENLDGCITEQPRLQNSIVHSTVVSFTVHY